MIRVLASKLLKILLFPALFLGTAGALAQPLTKQQLQKLDALVKESPVFSRSFTGFALFDPVGGQTLYAKDADKYFTPASNTKLFTFYTALRVLGDSMPVLRYAHQDGMLVFQGTGNPMLLHPDFPDQSQALPFLQAATQPLAFSGANFKTDHFGPGWSWADYRYSYQVERSALPLYGNFLEVFRDSLYPNLGTYPGYFQPWLRFDAQMDGNRPRVLREETGDRMVYNQLAAERDFTAEVPFNWSVSLAAALLADTLQRPVLPLESPLDSGLLWTTLKEPLPDTLLRLFLQESDNFIAEQLLLMCSHQLFGELDPERVIEYAQQELLADLPDETIWVDGSGLSRYNLFTPRTMVRLLLKIYQEVPRERLLGLLPAGGQSGTIANWYGSMDGPYVFAKTGTLANKHCLSGYLVTRSGKTLIFSFMHNNFVGSSNPLKAEMAKVLTWLRENY